jgi:dinuclear metal center YbgI/SA1388 family protein
MADAKKIAKFLNSTLSVKKIRDLSRNGLQFNSGEDVKKIGFSEDGCIDTFRKAKNLGCDMLIVHHGIIWKKDIKKAVARKRVEYLKKEKLSLYCAHLPLDAHLVFGNSACLAKALGLSRLSKFGKYGGIKVGFIGELNAPVSVGAFVKKVNSFLKTRSYVLAFGNAEVKKIALITGGGSDYCPEAKECGADLYLTGEVKLSAYHIAKELRINMVAAGHYATETLGVKALMPLLRKRFNVKTVFIENKVDL